jgi:small subunit ribosomal protein S9
MTSQEQLSNSNFSSYGLGKRKTSIAKVFLKSGTGKIIINEKHLNLFFDNIGDEKEMIKRPLLLLNVQNQVDLVIKVKGGGTNSQLDAIILALAKALSLLNSDYKKVLNQNLLLRRDSRIKERRKYGLKKARKASQYSKR